MSLIRTVEIKLLIELQDKDNSIDDLKKRIAAVPAAIAALNAAFEDKKNSMNAAKEALSRLLVSKKEKELRISEKDEEIKKHQRELNMVKENSAFKALLSEIEAAKKDKDDIETEILTILEEIDRTAVEDKKLQQETKKLEEEKNSEAARLEQARVKMEAELETSLKEREGFAAKIGPEIISKYEFIREQRKGVAIVAVKEDPKTGKYACGGCNMGLTAQTAVDVKKKETIVICEDCRRMIYLKKTVFDGPSDAQA